MAMKIEDVARIAGVSTATVSRVLNNPQVVSKNTRELVELTIAQCDFKPNLYARALMNGKTGTIGILVPFISNQYHMEIIESLEDELNNRDIRMFLCNTHDTAELEKKYLDDLIMRKVDAIVAVETSSVNSDIYDNFKNIPDTIPLILINEHRTSKTNGHIVRCAQEPGLLECIDYITAKNLFPLKIVLGSGQKTWSFVLKRQLFESELQKRGIDESLFEFVYIDNPNNEKNMKETVRFALECKRKGCVPRCFFAGNDLMASGLMQGLLLAGCKIPQDVALIGVDNTLVSRIAVPSISTVDLCCTQLGREVVYVLDELKQVSQKTIIRRTINSHFILRESC